MATLVYVITFSGIHHLMMMIKWLYGGVMSQETQIMSLNHVRSSCIGLKVVGEGVTPDTVKGTKRKSVEKEHTQQDEE